MPGNEFNPDERIIICYNPERAQVTRRKRDEKLNKSRDYLQSIIDKPPKRGRRKQPEKIITMVERNLRKMGTHKYFKYTFTQNGVFEYHDNLTTIDHAQRTDGICMLLTNSSKLNPEEVALGYRTLSEVEHAFKEIKNFLKIRPIYHYKDLRVRGHVFICVLAYLIEKFIEKKLKQSQLTISTQKALQKLKPIRMVRYTVMNKSLQKITNITGEQNEIFNSLGISEIPKVPVF